MKKKIKEEEEYEKIYSDFDDNKNDNIIFVTFVTMIFIAAPVKIITMIVILIIILIIVTVMITIIISILFIFLLLLLLLLIFIIILILMALIIAIISKVIVVWSFFKTIDFALKSSTHSSFLLPGKRIVLYQRSIIVKNGIAVTVTTTASFLPVFFFYQTGLF